MATTRILVTNDDGITAPGIAVLERVARTLSDDVWVVAPDFERSGASRSISLSDPIRIRQLDERHFSLMRGTPTDCVVTALSSLMRDDPPTLVLSGVNRGANLAEELTYSGTVAAAMEAAANGIRSISMSQIMKRGQPVRWHTAEQHAATVIRALLDLQPARGVFHNINFPDVEPAEVRGVRAARQGNWGSIQLTVQDRVDLRNFPYSWLHFGLEPGEQLDPDTDIGAAHSGWISVTPLHADLTHDASMAPLAERLRDTRLR